ncbi:MAG: DUF2341 domain-containing protein, partial [Chloroflexota bacterium]
ATPTPTDTSTPTATATPTDTPTPTATPTATPTPTATTGPPGWWDCSFDYRQQITISTGSSAAPAGYSVTLTFNHAALVSGGKSLANGNDVRIVYFNGMAWAELDRALDEASAWDSPSTTVWFRTQAAIGASSSDGNYYLYYGSTTAGSPPANRANVFDLWDDFANLASWSIFQDDSDSTPQSVSATVSGGVLTINAGGNLLSGVRHATYAPDNTYGFVVRTRARSLGVPSDDIAPAVWFINAPTGEIFAYESRDNANPTDRNRYIKKLDSSQPDGFDDNIQLDETTGPFAVGDVWYVYEVQRRTDGTIRAFRDGSQQFPPGGGWSVCVSQETGNSCLSTTSGGFGVGGESLSGEEYQFDWVWARKFVDPEPTTSLGAEELDAAYCTPTATPTPTPTATNTPTPTATSTPAPTATSTPTPGAGGSTYWFYDDTAPLTYMMYTSQPAGISQSASDSTINFYSDTFMAGQSLQAGTTTVYFYATNSFGSPLAIGIELLAGDATWTTLGGGAPSIPANTTTPTFFQISFGNLGYTFSSGERVQLRVSVGAPLGFYWDGAYNTSRLVLP